jgi:hypothetical protein
MAALIGRNKKNRRVAARQRQRAAQIFLHLRAQDVAQQQWRRLAAELGKGVAEDAKERQQVDVGHAVGKAQDADGGEQQD